MKFKLMITAFNKGWRFDQILIFPLKLGSFCCLITRNFADKLSNSCQTVPNAFQRVFSKYKRPPKHGQGLLAELLAEPVSSH
jgi:hypothetical protein